MKSLLFCRLHLKCDGTRLDTRFCLSAKRTSPFISAGVSVQSTTGSRGVHIGGSNAGYTKFRVRASAHERFFAAAAKQPQRSSISWLCSRTVKETQRSHISLTICQCVRYGFCGAVGALLLRTRAKKRKRLWVHPLVSQRLLKGQFHKLYEDLRIQPLGLVHTSGWNRNGFFHRWN